jgi:hypothetical protein
MVWYLMVRIVIILMIIEDTSKVLYHNNII